MVKPEIVNMWDPEFELNQYLLRLLRHLREPGFALLLVSTANRAQGCDAYGFDTAKAAGIGVAVDDENIL